jgi:hypothetical protein
MIDLEGIRRRMKRLEEDVAAAGESAAPALVSQIDSLAADVSDLVQEIESLRSLCRHSHLLDVYDGEGRPTGTYTCVNCHKNFSADRPLS